MSYSFHLAVDPGSDHAEPVTDSQETDDASPISGPRTCVTLEFGNQAFAIDVGIVREILDFRTITPLPNAPSDLLGMIDLRGESIAVIDPTARLGLRGGRAEPERIIVLEPRSEARQAIGVIADRVLSVIECAPDSIEPMPQTMTAWSSDGVLGVLRVSGRQTILLDLARIIAKDDADAFDFA